MMVMITNAWNRLKVAKTVLYSPKNLQSKTTKSGRLREKRGSLCRYRKSTLVVHMEISLWINVQLLKSPNQIQSKRKAPA